MVAYKILLSFFIVILFISCGGKTTSNPLDDENTTISSANFIDAPVQGIAYSCSDSNTSGTTNENGTFDYDSNCGTITFSIGGVTVYSKDITQIPSDNQLYITDLVGVDRTDTNNSKVLNIARFIQSLDDDNNPYNGIKITPDVTTALSDSTIDFSANPSVNDLNNTITSLGRTLVDEEDAQAHFTYTLNNDLDLEIEGPPPPAPILTIMPEITQENSITVEVNGQPLTSVYLNGSDTGIDITSGTAKALINLDTLGADGSLDFNISLKESADFGGRFSDALLFSIIKDTIAPTITSSNSFTSSENTSVIGDIVATDASVIQYQAVQYAISGGIDANQFSINSSTGELSYIASLDFENPTDHDKNNIYLVEVEVNDGIHFVNQSITITVTNVAETIPVLDNATLNFNENLPNTTIIYEATNSNNFNSGDSNITGFTLKNNDDSIQSIFSIDINGTIKVLDSSALDYETFTPLQLKINATNGAGTSVDKTITITLNDTFDVPPTLTNNSFNVIENIAGGSYVGQIVYNSGDSVISNFELNNSLDNSASSEFSISNTGAINVNPSASIDYETTSIYNLEATAYNSAGVSNTVAVTINITNIPNEITPILASFSGSIDENITTVGYKIGDITVSNSAQLDTNITSFNLTGSGSSNFEVNNDGEVLLSSGANLDYENITKYDLTLTATNDAGTSNPVNITININDISDTPPVLESFTGYVTEDSANGFQLGTMSFESGDSAIVSFDLNNSDGSTQSIFSINTSGVISVNDNSTIDYDNGVKIYSLIAQASNSLSGSNIVNVTINVLNQSDIKPTIANFTTSINEDILDGSVVGNLAISNGDSAIEQITIKEINGSANNDFIVSNGGTISIKSGSNIDYELRTIYNLRAIATNASGDSPEANITININDLKNEEVPILSSFNGTIDENATAGSEIGSITVTDEGDSNITSFTLTGNNAGAFSIDSNGTITLANGVTLDYESNPNYTLSVYATNEAGDSASVLVSIDIKNIAEIVPTLQPFSGSIIENALNGSIIGTLSFTKGDSNITNFDLNETNGSAQSIFGISNEGVITLLSTDDIDYETKSSYILNAIASNSAGDSNSVTVTITITNATDTVPTLEDFNGSINENSSAGTSVGNIVISDNGDSSISQIIIRNSDLSVSNEFRASTTGVLEVKSGAILDYETKSFYPLEAIAVNESGNSNTVDVNITLNNLRNEVIPVLSSFSQSVEENITAGTEIGTISVTNLGDLDSNISAFTLIGSGAGNFDIDLNGTVTLASNVTLDYETTPTYNLTLTATNDAGTSLAKAVTINISNVAESVPSLTPFSGSLSVSETAPNGLNIGTVVYSSDTNITGFEIYESDETTLSSEFNISLDGVISIEDNSTFDYDTTQLYSVKIQASNSFGDSSFLPITINITNVANTLPTVDNASFTINENIINGSTVGNLVLTSGDAPINSIVLKNRSDNSISTQFSASITGTITSIATIDYESNSSYDLYAVASSSIGSSDEANITISINNLRNEVIPELSSFTASAEENITAGTEIGTITVENNTSLDSNISAFTLIGSGAGNFDIDLNGTVTLASGVTLDYETTPTYNLTLTATNDAGTSLAKAVTINVSNVAEIKPTLQAFSGSINEDANNNDIIGTFNFVSGDSNISSFTLFDNDGVTTNDEFNITTEGVISVKDNLLLDYETTPSYSLKAKATNDAGDSNIVTVTINVNNISDATPLLANFTTTINENINGGSEVGTLTITDAGDSAISDIIIKNRSDNTTSTQFEVTNIGTIKTLPNATIDYESNSSYTLYAIATNASGDSPEANITININDLKNEDVPEIETVSLSITENSSANTTVGSITIIDEGDSNITSFTLSGTQATDFTIDSNGIIKVASGAQIDYEDTTTYTLSAFATNSAGNSDSVSILIDVTNIAETPPTLEPFTGSINEDAANDTVIGTLEFESGDSVVTNFTIYDENPNSASSSSSLSIPATAQNNLSLYTQYLTKNSKKPESLTSFLSILNSQEYYTQMSQTSYDNPNSGMFNKLIAITDLLASNNEVPVILEIQTEFYPEGLLDEDTISSQRESIFSLHTQIINNHLLEFPEILESIYIFDNIPYFSAKLTQDNFWEILSIPGIIGIEIIKELKPQLAQSTTLIGANSLWSAGYTGTGQTIAILDSGVLNTHEDFEGRVVSEACYSGSVGGESTCPGSVTESILTNSGLNCDNTTQGCDHGTHVASIAAGSNGVAPDANIIAMQVFSYTNGGANIGSYDNDFIKGLERVYTLKDTYSIASANMSLGGGEYSSYCDESGYWQSATKAAIDNLKSVGIATIIASGNDSYRGSVAYPACISTAITVGATTDTSINFSEGNYPLDSVTPYSNHNGIIDLLAPGSLISAAVSTGNSDYGDKHGTSMATPHVAGAFALIKEINGTLGVENTLSLLQDTGVSVNEPVTNISRKRINLDAALTTLQNGYTPSTSMFDISLDGVISLSDNSALDYESNSSYLLYVKATNDAGDSNIVTATINVNDVSDVTPIVEDLNFSINENITDTLTPLANLITDNGDAQITSIVLRDQDTNTTSNEFKVSTTGVITLKSGAIIDYETTPSYSLFAVATNANGDSNEANITVTINNLTNEIIPTIEALSINIDENITSGTVIGDINISDSGDSNISFFVLSGTGASNFNVELNGTLTIANGANIDYETKPIYLLDAVASNDAGESSSVPLTISIIDIPETAPILTNYNTTSIDENASNNALVGTISYTTETNISSFVLYDEDGTTPSDEFNISLDGVIYVKDSSSFDYETKTSYTIKAQATNSFGPSNMLIITINLRDIQDTPPVLEDLNISVNENETDISKVLGNIIITQGDATIQSITLRKQDDNQTSTHFKASTIGTITIKTDSVIDYEMTPIHSLYAIASTQAGDSNEVNVTINVIDVAEVKPILAPTIISIDENVTDGTKIGELNITNFDELDSTIHSFTVDGVGSSNFRFDENGSVYVSNGAYIDYEDPNEQDHQFVLNVKAINSVGSSNIVNFTVNINDVYEQPPILNPFTGFLDENATNNTLIGQIDVNTTGDAPITSYEMNASQFALPNFEINTTGHIILKNNSGLDYDTLPNVYVFAVTASSSAGTSTPVLATINLIDISEIPPTLTNGTIDLDENVTEGYQVGSVFVSDPGDSDFLSCTLSGTDASSFVIDSNGDIFVANGITFNYNVNRTYNFDVQCSNVAGPSNFAAIVVNIIDVPTELAQMNPLTLNINEGTPPGTQIGQIEITSSDSAITAIDMTWNPNDVFEISLDGNITIKEGKVLQYLPNDHQYKFEVTAYNALGASTPALITINILNIDDFYIQSAIYDNNNTYGDANVTDDILYLFFSKSVDISTFANSPEDDLNLTSNINTIGKIGSASITTYEDTPFHLYSIALNNNNGQTSYPFIPYENAVGINFAALLDAEGSIPTSYPSTTIEELYAIIKTGQTNSYDNDGTLDGSIQDDGYFESGETRNYVADATYDIVYDYGQKLIWQDTAANTSTASYTNSVSYCESLNTTNFANMEGWRIPTRQELFNLVDKSRVNPAIDSTFNHISNSYYWAVTQDASNSDKAWVIKFDYGTSTTTDKTELASRYIRCVKDFE